MKRTTYAVLVVALLVVSTLLLVPGQALADVPTKASSTWQTNGIVYAVAYARGNVYIGGAFTSVRPPGAAPGTGEVARNHLAAFNATTGALLSFNHNANATVYSLEPSPDKTRRHALRRRDLQQRRRPGAHQPGGLHLRRGAAALQGDPGRQRPRADRQRRRLQDRDRRQLQPRQRHGPPGARHPQHLV